MAAGAMKPARITVHCTDTPNGESVSAAEIRRWHLERGFSDIGYHFVINVDGELEKGRPVNVMGAHVKGANQGNVGICLVGRDRFTRAQFDTLLLLLNRLTKEHRIKLEELYCHYQWPTAIAQGKSCPNIPIDNLRGWFMDEDWTRLKCFLYDL